jgi:hypothetical protein
VGFLKHLPQRCNGTPLCSIGSIITRSSRRDWFSGQQRKDNVDSGVLATGGTSSDCRCSLGPCRCFRRSYNAELDRAGRESQWRIS